MSSSMRNITPPYTTDHIKPVVTMLRFGEHYQGVPDNVEHVDVVIVEQNMNPIDI